jgi:hypothetical protein
VRRESRPADNEAASTTAADDAQYNDQPHMKPGKSLVWIPCTRRSPQDTHSQLERRRDAAHRSVPLGCGHRDPWVCGCYATEPPLTDNQLDGWRDAALKVLSCGQLPLLPIEVRRALWKRGGPDRVLAEKLHQACGGEVA